MSLFLELLGWIGFLCYLFPITTLSRANGIPINLFTVGIILWGALCGKCSILCSLGRTLYQPGSGLNACFGLYRFIKH